MHHPAKTFVQKPNESRLEPTPPSLPHAVPSAQPRALITVQGKSNLPARFLEPHNLLCISPVTLEMSFLPECTNPLLGGTPLTSEVCTYNQHTHPSSFPSAGSSHCTWPNTSSEDLSSTAACPCSNSNPILIAVRPWAT